MGRVLLVEDYDGVHEVLCNLIEETGHEAECVKTKQEALARLVPASHHLVIADVRLPDGLGHAVAERAAELGIKTVLMSGHPDELHSLGVSDVVHLAKPFGIADFLPRDPGPSRQPAWLTCGPGCSWLRVSVAASSSAVCALAPWRN